MEINQDYMKKGMDLKRMLLCFQRKLWVFLMLTAVGAAMGGMIYQMVRAMRMPVSYEAVSKLYISFGVDESGEIYQYYNGYTWNELLDAEPIISRIMENLTGDYKREAVKNATTAEILSDIRLLTVTVEGETEKFVREVQQAVELGLMEYAKDSEELKRIEVIRTDSPERTYWDERTPTACILGGVLFAAVTLLIMAIIYVLDEGVYVQEDIEKIYPYKALGLLTRNQRGLQPYARELRANLLYAFEKEKLGRAGRRFALIDMENHSDVRSLEIERVLNLDESELMGAAPGEDGLTWAVPHEKTEEEKAKEWKAVPFNANILSGEECRQIRELGGAVILLPFGEDVGRKVSRLLSLLKNQDCPVLGMVITQADEEFLSRYYS